MVKKISIQSLTIAFCSIIISFILLKILCRIIGISYPKFHTWDPYTGTALIPYAQGWQQAEGKAYIKINSQGLRDDEHSIKKPADTLRIVVVGDSFTEASQVPVENTFWSILEDQLKTCPHNKQSDVEVINMGVSSTGTGQQLLKLRHHGGWDYKPDIVVLAFFIGNDIVNNSRMLEGSSHIPYLVYQDEKLVVDNSFRELPTSKWIRNSVFYRMWVNIRAKSHLVQMISYVQSVYRVQEQKSQTKQLHQKLNLSDNVYVAPESKIWQEAWQVTEEIIRQMNNEAASHNAQLFVFTIGGPIQVHPDSSIRRQYMEDINVDNLFYPNQRIKALQTSDEIIIFDFIPEFQKYAEGNQMFLHGFQNATLGGGHWNQNGHQLAGEMLSQSICEQLK